MYELKDIYERIAYLRRMKVRMKDMADATGLAPSVLSALYTTVIPAYMRGVQHGLCDEKALDEALVLVNNVSKRKVMASMKAVLHALQDMDISEIAVDDADTHDIPFIAYMERAVRRTPAFAAHLCGTYLSYSLSSAHRCMKIEPYLLAPAKNGEFLEVVHLSVYGKKHKGMAMMNGASHVYIVFNEGVSPQLELFNICLKLPMYDNPTLLRGLYMCLDYNHNPIARRIVFVKQSDSVDRTEFGQMSGMFCERENLDDRQKEYFDYTCGHDDVIRMCNVPVPTMTTEDLKNEKGILASLDCRG